MNIYIGVARALTVSGLKVWSRRHVAAERLERRRTMNVATENTGAGQCPVMHGRSGRTNRDWWPNRLSLQMLYQHSPRSNPMGEAFDYARNSKASTLTP